MIGATLEEAPTMDRRRKRSDDSPEAVAGRLQSKLGSMVEILLPSDCESPILAPSVRQVVFEWITEIRAAADLEAVGLKVRQSSLLYGPPGCGKTTLAHHFAARIGLPLVVARGELVISKWVGQSGEQIAKLFDALRAEEGNVVSFFDEIDAVAASRGDGETSAGKEKNNVVTAMLTNLERFKGIFFAATNRADAIDPAIWRRFGMHIEVALPDFDCRFAILKQYGAPFLFEDAFLDEIAITTQGAPPSLLRQVMEGLKRALVLGPKLKRPVDDPVALLKLIVAGTRPHPDYSDPPLWANPKAVEAVAGMAWPPALPETRA